MSTSGSNNDVNNGHIKKKNQGETLSSIEQVMLLIRKITRSVNLESEVLNKEFGLTVHQLLCLRILYEAPNYQVVQTDIANKMSINTSTMNGIVKRLEKNGFLVQLPNKGDLRFKNITLSRKGYNFIKSNPDLLSQRIMHKFNLLTDEDVKKIETSLKLLDRHI